MRSEYEEQLQKCVEEINALEEKMALLQAKKEEIQSNILDTIPVKCWVHIFKKLPHTKKLHVYDGVFLWHVYYDEDDLTYVFAEHEQADCPIEEKEKDIASITYLDEGWEAREPKVKVRPRVNWDQVPEVIQPNELRVFLNNADDV